MRLHYTRISKEDDEMRNLIDDGEYQAVILHTEATKTKPGFDKNGKPKIIRDMLVLDLEVYLQDGRKKLMKDWIVNVENMEWRMRHLAIACDLLEDYDNGTLEDEFFINKNVVIKIQIKDGEDKKGNPIKRNAIIDYFAPVQHKVANSTPLVAAPKQDGFLNDDVPF